jgi:3'-5' exoribonuclease
MQHEIVNEIRNFDLAINHVQIEQFNLNSLLGLMQSIQSPALTKFLGNLFGDKEVMNAFLQLPASIRHHHNYVGGLMAHSIEAAEIARQLKYECVEDRDITVVATLLHDIGKTKSYTTNIKTTNLGKMVSHDHLTLEVCASALKILDQDWPDAANTLRHIWTCASPGSRYGFQPSTPLANIVKFADKFSVDSYDHKNAFKNNFSNSGFAWNEKRYFWNASNEKIKPERRRICF